MSHPGLRRGHAALRAGRVSLPRHVYHVTIVTASRRAFFERFDLARTVARLLHDPRILGDASTICWVAMPDHLHWLLRLGARDPLSRVVARFKTVSAALVNRAVARVGEPVWMPSFYDRALRYDEDVRIVARYIVGNPIRAGLCRSEAQYPHWDCVWDWDWD